MIHVLINMVAVILAIATLAGLGILFSIDLPNLPDHLDERDWS